MKNFIIVFFCFASVNIAFGQTALADGDRCFDNGDYSCAVLKYQEAMDKATGRDKQMAEIKLTRAQSCSEWLTSANRSFNAQDYYSAKENYELLIKENPNDVFVKLQLEKTIEAINKMALTSQKALADGDSCFNNGDYKCAQQKYLEAINTADSRDKQIAEIKYSRAQSCIEWLTNANSAFNSGNFREAKEKYELVKKENPNDVYVSSQLEKAINALVVSTTLVVSKSYINFGPSENSTTIDVKTNASKFEITRLPIWCTTRNKQSDWFSLVCKENYSTQSRSDYLIITAGDKQVRIDITQSGKTEQKREPVVEKTPIPEAPKEKEKVKIQKTKIKKSPNSFFAVGLEAGEIANYGVRMEFGGRRFVGMFLNARSTLKNDNDILRSAGFVENKNEAVLGLNFKISRSIFLNLGGGYGFYKQKLSSDTVENIDYYPAYGGLTFRLGNRFNLSGGASFMNIEESYKVNRYRPEYTVALTINLKK